jgi:diadenosine tetraphosphate (Ap4A) HIT family hydrolase
MEHQCLTCQFNNNPGKSPGGWIKEYNYWILEHINEPIPVLGWLVLKTKRHTDGIVGLNADEAKELGEILYIVPKVLKQVTNAEMIYIVTITELVKHMHMHIVPRYKNAKMGSDLLCLLDEVKKDKDLAQSVQKSITLVEKIRNNI